MLATVSLEPLIIMNPLIFTQTAAVSPVPRMRIRLLTVFSILSLCGGVVGLRAESVTSDWFYRAWQTEDGLPDNTISGIAQSADGYLWVGTKGGVMRFNGTHFKPLPLRNIPDLPSRAVRVMFLDRAGNAWIGLQRGPLIRIGGDSYDAFDEDDGIPAGRPISLTDDAGGRVWVSYHDGVCSITDKKVTWFRQEITRGQDIRLACDAAGQVWLGNKGKLGRFADDGFELVHTFPDATINVAGAKGSGLWITAGSTLFKTGEESQLHIWATLPENAEVNVIFEDRSGAVWIGTRKEGLLRVLKDTVESVATSHVWVDCVTEDREGNIWAGTLGGGLNLIRPRAIEFPDQTAGLPFGSVQSVTCDRAGRLWAVGQNGLFASRTSGGWTLHPLPISVNCVVADAQGQVWVGSRGQDVFRINGEEQERFEIPGHSKTYVRSLFAAKNGDIWRILPR